MMLVILLMVNTCSISAMATENDFPEEPDTFDILIPEETVPTEETAAPETTQPTEETLPPETEPEETVAETEPEETEPEETEPDLKTYDTVPLYFQNDYPDTMFGAGTVETSGCSITCLAMVATYLTWSQVWSPMPGTRERRGWLPAGACKPVLGRTE